VELWIIFVVELRNNGATYNERARGFYISVLFISRLYVEVDINAYSSNRAKRSNVVVILAVLNGSLTFMM
jgi:DNA invertase Pin-like site-specific DNA recombinase